MGATSGNRQSCLTNEGKDQEETNPEDKEPMALPEGRDRSVAFLQPLFDHKRVG